MHCLCYSCEKNYFCILNNENAQTQTQVVELNITSLYAGDTSPIVPTTTESPTGTCVNLHTSNSECETWGRNGHCDRNPGFMHINCAKTCGTCTGASLTTTTSAPITTKPSETIPPPNPGW